MFPTQPAVVATAALLLLALLATSCDGASNYSDCGTNYTTLERALLDTGDNYYKIWTTFYPPGSSSPLYIDITYNFQDQEDGSYTNDTISFISVASAVFLKQPPNVFGLTSLFFGETVRSKIVTLNLTFPHECRVLVNEIDSVPSSFLDVLTQRMKLYATYYRHERIVITDDYPIISVRDVKGGKLDKYFRSATYSTILFVSVLLGLPLICLVSVIIIVKGARWQIRKTLNSERVSFQASFSSTVAIGWVFSLFVLVMDAAAIYEANVDNNILSNQASHEYGSLPLFWITGVTVAIDVASFVIGMVLLIASARYKSSECCNIFCHCTCKCKENVSKKPEIELDTVPFGVNSDKTEAEKPENERVNSDKTEAEKPENERVNSDKTEAEKPENERVNSDKTEAEKPENERVNSDKTEAEKERVNSDKTEAEKERVNSRERRMWLIMISLIAPIVCFGSHVGYCIIAWLSFPSTGSAVFTMYTLTFTFYFITLRQLYVALVTWSAPKTKYSTDSKKQRLMVSEERAKYKEIGKEGVNVYVLFALIGAGILLAVCQVWLASGLVLLPISNLIESAPLYLQSAVNTAFLTITGLFALNIFVIKPRKKNRQDKILKFVLQNMKQPADTSTTQPPKAAQESAIPGKAQQPATTEEYSREEELGNLIAKLLVSNLEVIEIFKEKNSRK